ncbi:MAG: hypothetical protein FJ272_05845 [Planctomycetes bacterium]|nr:hypothetical protein [Planctomycetota bacterium]MBM4084293.1 hypothetical protein [Planctomycetota bacterium]
MSSPTPSASEWFPNHAHYPQVCHFADDKPHLLLLTTDDDHYSIYSGVFRVTEAHRLKSSLGIVVAPYVEGGPYPEMAPPYPSWVELREAFLAGHGIVMHGYNHTRELWLTDANASAETRRAIRRQFDLSRQGIFERLTQHPIITMWPCWSLDHVRRGHGEVGREADYVYCAQRQQNQIFRHKDLVLPTTPIEVFQNSRDRWDVHDQLSADVEAGGCYTHLWGHGTMHKPGDDKALAAQLAKLSNDHALLSRVWSTSSERAARYIIERRFASVRNWRDEDGVWAYELSFSLPPDLPSLLMGKPVWNAPLTVKHANMPAEPARFAYEDTPSGLRRLSTRLDCGTLCYNVVPRGQTIRISPRPLHDAATKPNVVVSAQKLAVTRPCDGQSVRGGAALEILVTASDPRAEIVSCQLTIRDPSGKPFTNAFGRRIEDYELPENDWLVGSTGETTRGLIVYPVEAGYAPVHEFTLVATATNAHGESATVRESARS